MSQCSSAAARLCGRVLSTEGDGTVAQEARAFIERCTAGMPAVPDDVRDAGELPDALLGHLHCLSLRGPWTLGSSAAASFALLQNAPCGLLSGCVLQGMANAANSHEELAARAHRVHAWQLGSGRLADHHGLLYRRLLEACGHELAPVASPRFTADTAVLPVSWSLPAYRLGLSLFPEQRWPEILGAALFELSAPVAQVVSDLADTADVPRQRYCQTRGDAQADRAREEMKQAIAAALAAGRAEGPSHAPSASRAAGRIAQGFLVSLRLFQAWQADLERHVRGGGLSPSRAMVELVRRKGLHAVGYHGRLKLAGQAFDERIVSDPEGFVNDLAGSRWVRPGEPERSPLLTQLLAFGGPMFRIFSDQEVETMRVWIRTLEPPASAREAVPRLTPAAPREPAGQAPPWRNDRARALAPGRSSPCEVAPGALPDARALFHRLMNLERHEHAASDALCFVLRWLARASRVVNRGPDPMPFADYSPTRFRHWFEARSTAQARSYSGPPASITKPRAQVINDALQLCPMVLVDGAWLQRWPSAGLADTRIGALLCKIYSDEIGNGDARQNHPNIYRRLMAQMGVTLHDVRSEQFARDPRFDDAAFEVPAFWLGLSLFPRRFLPETLGLNLAMELSGVGGAYRVARDELAHYGFDTLFVDLHNTIDNVSTGHSAMAAEAIEWLMEEALASCDQHFIADQWRRVWTGFRSLAPPKAAWSEILLTPRYRGQHSHCVHPRLRP